jgi:hypothetical protein
VQKVCSYLIDVTLVFFKYVHNHHYYGHGSGLKQQQQCLVCYNNTLMCSKFAGGNAFLCLLEVQLYPGYYLLVHETGSAGHGGSGVTDGS